MRRRAAFASAALLIAVALTAPARAAVGPLYDVKASWGDTNLSPGDTNSGTSEGQFVVRVRNVGDATGSKDLVIEDRLPGKVTATAVHWPVAELDTEDCIGVGTGTVTCTVDATLLPSRLAPLGTHGSGPGLGAEPSGYMPSLYIDVSVPAKTKVPTEGTNTAIVYGGSGALPGGSPCAQVVADLATLPPCAEDLDQVQFEAGPSSFGLVPGGFSADVFNAAYPFGVPSRQASDRPFEFRINFDINERSVVNPEPPNGDGTRYIAPNGTVRTVEATLPRGMIGNPEALPKCDPADFAEPGSTPNSTACPASTQLGYLNVDFNDGNANYGAGDAVRFDPGLLSHVPLYNLVPPRGTPVDLGFNAGGLVQAHVYAVLDPSQDYAIKTVTPNISNLVQARGSEVTVWGVPGDPSHDRFRYYSKGQPEDVVIGSPFGAAIRPYLTNPMDCGFENRGMRFRIDSYQHPGEFTLVQEYNDPLNVSGCDDPRFRFEPQISLQPTDRHAGAPTGLDVHLKVPQRNDEVKEAKKLYAEEGSVEAMATPPIKRAVVTLPEGMTLNPSAAQGLEACTSKQIGLGTDSKVECPAASQYGTLILHTPILPATAQPEGHIYIAKQVDNPFHNFLSIYLAIEEPDRGILVKLPGKVDLDPATGQITTTFDEVPQFPVSDMQMTLKGGVRAGLVEPSTCGEKTITAEFFSWQDPLTPHVVRSSYEVTEKPDGSPCVNNLGERPFRPSLEAGTANNTAGKYAPFAFRLTRSDDDQEFSQVGVTMAKGLTGKLAGVGRCTDAGIAQATSRTGPGEGALEEGDPSCPASALIGSTDVGAGVGVPLTYVPGKVYLAGPYQGAPLSIVVITPAVVGPFDLGVIAVRTALRLDPETAQVSAFSDPFPQIYQGIPVRIRDIRLNLDRPDFTLNPTSCAEKQIGAHVTGTGGDVGSTADDTGADLTNRFQAADCASLRFGPRLHFRLVGGTHRGAHPSLRALLRGRNDDANIAGASVALPHSEFLDQGHIKTVCTRVQFVAKQCPPGSVYGQVIAHTPLFEEPLSGPAYLRSSSHQLPDLVVVLQGPASLPIEVDLVGRVDSLRGGIRNTFEVVPDAPVDTFRLEMLGGKKGLLINSTDLCAKVNRAITKFKAQNGRQIVLHPVMRASCGKKRSLAGGR